jgi:hypothetical protein
MRSHYKAVSLPGATMGRRDLSLIPENVLE